MTGLPAAALVAPLALALRQAGSPLADCQIEPMPDKGLAHHHLRLRGSGLIARLPKQSQMGLAAGHNLAYQAACFQRAQPSGATPALHGRLAPGSALPRGGLLVEEIVGRSARLPEDLSAIARALAAIHALPLPARQSRAPLRDDADPLAALAQEIDAQASHLAGAGLAAASLALIERQRAALRRRCAAPERPGRRLIAFDAHPGNFIIRSDGSAVLVDLEKARYSHPALDLAHATLYTSTTWDLEVYAELSPAQVGSTYSLWLALAGLDPADRAWCLPLRSAMWLWAVTWCAQWRALAPLPAQAGADGQDWSQRHSADALVSHVRERVEHYLSAPVIAQIVDGFAALDRSLAWD